MIFEDIKEKIKLQNKTLLAKELGYSNSTKFEITLEQIEEDSKILLIRKKYNELSRKDVFFTTELEKGRFEAFQLVGDCGGYGHDYDLSYETSYVIISNETIKKLKDGEKSESILKIEEMRNKAQNRGEVQGLKLIDETTFYEYMNMREQFQRKEIVMHINEFDVDEEYRIKQQ